MRIDPGNTRFTPPDVVAYPLSQYRERTGSLLHHEPCEPAAVEREDNANRSKCCLVGFWFCGPGGWTGIARLTKLRRHAQALLPQLRPRRHAALRQGSEWPQSMVEKHGAWLPE